jgi:O-antigen/teichoic acid export membrane protein
MLTLEMFGYYTLAFTVSRVIFSFQVPICSAVFPRLCQFISLPDHTELIAFYHKACQFLSVIVLPAAIVLSLFSSEIMLLWTGKNLIASNTQYLISILVIGNMFNILMNLPTGLTYAIGWTTLSVYTNIIAIIVLVPMMLILIKYYGAIGAAVSWLTLNIGYILIVIHIIHARLLKGEQWRWYFRDVGIPLLAALAIALLWRMFVPNNMSRIFMLFYLLVVSMTTLISSAIMTPYTRFLIGRVLISLRVR